MNDFGLYVIITNPVLPYRRVAEICVNEGVKMLQLREKHLSDVELLKIAKEITAITRGSDTKFIVNDRIDIAFLSGADGVHLGQDDLSIEDARDILGENKIIGLSTHSVEQARNAIIKNPDYIGYGPIYKTPTKAVPDAVVGLNNLYKVVNLSSVPVVAIGGINSANSKMVVDSGARNICSVRYLMEFFDLEQRIKYLQSVLKKQD